VIVAGLSLESIPDYPQSSMRAAINPAIQRFPTTPY